MINLSVVIINHNTRTLLEECLHSILANTPNLDFEIFVVDNASSDGSSQMVKEKFPEVRLIENRTNIGFAKASNQAIKQAQGRYILLLNSDTVVLPDSLDKMVKFMDEHSEAGVMGCKLLNSDGTLQPSGRAFPTLLSEISGLMNFERPKKIRECEYDKPADVDEVSGACMLLRRETLDEVGPLDERFFMYYEDIDLCYRIKQGNWKVTYNPDVRIIHHWGSKEKNNPHLAAAHIKSRNYFFNKHYGTPLTYTLKAISIGLLVLGSLKQAIKPLLSWNKGEIERILSRNWLLIKANLQDNDHENR